eukprot:CAMPEP_0197470384 /NCGR_PEP_ID=MMETSP1309-20131121/1091_1 /TAXON_ID=464262 /ORGANISM="Genus nov. species nov., Strain RCC998" /LENGTH=91 /DNA_ID=CAMNT_0043007211 /DNA_START=197 /DNA_END=470 /DNA_ORIENTATION=-
MSRKTSVGPSAKAGEEDETTAAPPAATPAKVTPNPSSALLEDLFFLNSFSSSSFLLEQLRPKLEQLVAVESPLSTSSERKRERKKRDAQAL